jgi:hypothetical protein
MMKTLPAKAPITAACLAILAGLFLADVSKAGIAFECVIDGAHNVPALPVPGTGTGSFFLNDAQTELAYYIEFSDLTSPENFAHFHNAGPGFNGMVVYNLPLGSPKIGVWPITPAQVTELLFGRIYVNIHTEVYILGEIRGNLAVVASGVDPPPEPRSNSLGPNYPNPFNPRTTIKYTIGRETHVSLRVFDASGRLIKTLVDRAQSPGEVSPVEWDGRDETGQLVASGVYFYQLQTRGFSQTRRMVLLK